MQCLALKQSGPCVVMKSVVLLKEPVGEEPVISRGIVFRSKQVKKKVEQMSLITPMPPRNCGCVRFGTTVCVVLKG